MNTRLGLAALATVTLATMTTIGAPITSGPASSAAPTGDCAVPFPVAEVTPGAAVTGLTVSRGTTPEAFTGEVLGVVNGGIAPDLDLVMVRLTSPEIDRVGGIWQGMSGSPVYAGDGRLIGAVAYGLAFGPSPVAGVTPFEYMDDYATTPLRVQVSHRLARRIAAATDVSVAQAAQGFEELPLVGGVSGVQPDRLTGGRPYLDEDIRSWGTASTTAAGPESIVAGGNLGVTMAYGDVTIGGVGTTTSVCDQRVIGFGHPMDFRGEITAVMHPAEAVYVQEDPTMVPFKVANLGQPAGTITDDHRAGITGTLGPLPDTFAVRSTVTYASHARTGETQVSLEAYIPEATFYQVVGNHDRVMDKFGPGTEDARWTITGTRPNGQPFTVRLGQQYLSTDDITMAAAWDLPDGLWFLTGYPGVGLSSVSTRAVVTDDTTTWRVVGMERRSGGEWVTLETGSTVTVKAGRTLRLRAVLASQGARRTVGLPIDLPAGLAGTSGKVRLYAGQQQFSYSEFWDASTFRDFLATARRAVRADQVVAWASMLDEPVVSTPLKKVVDELTPARDQSFRLVIR